MTFKDLQKLLVQSQQSSNPEQIRLLKKLRDKPFWIWDQEEHKKEDIRTQGLCCFNHIIGLPKKDGHDMPLLPYQKILCNSLQDHKHIWIKKSRGIGVTEILLRYIGYCCVTSKFPVNSRVIIITGPRIDLAEDLVDRFKHLFSFSFSFNNNTLPRTENTVAIVNGVKLEAFPSHHVDTARGLTDVRFILIDEADYFPKFQQQEVRAVAEGYIGKPNSDPWILLVSTPKAPGGLFDQIEHEQSSLYHKLFFDYRYGLQEPYPIYTRQDIERARCSPEFGREYELQYLGLIGNVFSVQSIENCQKVEYNPDLINIDAHHSIGIDPGFGSSQFAIVATEYSDGIIKVVYADEFERALFQSMVDKVWQLKQMYRNISAIYVDAANPEIIHALKSEFQENTNWNYIHEKMLYCKKNNLDIEQYMKVIPVPFSVEGARLLQHTKNLLESQDQLIAINPKFDKLITSLRTAVANEYKLDKEATSFNDLLDALRLALSFFKLEK